MCQAFFQTLGMSQGQRQRSCLYGAYIPAEGDGYHVGGSYKVEVMCSADPQVGLAWLEQPW